MPTLFKSPPHNSNQPSRPKRQRLTFAPDDQGDNPGPDYMSYESGNEDSAYAPELEIDTDNDSDDPDWSPSDVDDSDNNYLFAKW